MPQPEYYPQPLDLPKVSKIEIPARTQITLELTEDQAFHIWALSHMLEGGESFPTGRTLLGDKRNGYRIIEFFPKDLTIKWESQIKEGSRTIDGAEKAIKAG